MENHERMQIFEYMCISEIQKDYFSQYNLPNNLTENFIGIKIESI